MRALDLGGRVAPVAMIASAFTSFAALIAVFGSAGMLIRDDAAAESLHGFGAVLLHVTTGVTTAAAVLLAALRRLGWATAAIAGVVFVAGFVQAGIGDDATLPAHVLGALLVTIGVVWTAAQAIRVRAASTTVA